MGSILLGQSRIMTTFGGSIMGWTSEGDITAGAAPRHRGVHATQRVYDNWGNVSLSPAVEHGRGYRHLEHRFRKCRR